MSKERQASDKVPPRRLTDGGWYWIDRNIVQNYARAIGATGVAVYNVLASMADSNQECYPSQQRIGDLLGYSRATVNKVLKVLERRGLIAVSKRNAHGCTYQLSKVRCKTGETEMSTRGNQDVPPVDTNDNQLIRINNDIIVRVKKEEFEVAVTGRGSEFLPETREELLAHDLAAALNEPENLSWYLYLAKRHPESLLRQILSETKEIPKSEIRKNPPALFNYLLKKRIRKPYYDPSH